MFVEFVFFKAKPNVSDSQIMENAHKIQQLAEQMGTPFKLELLKSEEGEWVEIVRWTARKRHNGWSKRS